MSKPYTPKQEMKSVLQGLLAINNELRAENARLRESAELNADYHRREMKLQTEIALLALEESSALRAENARLRGALADMYAGWRYIRLHYGDLSGVGWERCDAAARAALEVKP
jgi:regulator of replication initiation timing